MFKVGKVKLTHFKASEFACKCGCGAMPEDELMLVMDKIRKKLKLPIRINSGKRCVANNNSIPGSPRSQHLHGLAVDIHVPDSEYRHKLLKVLFEFDVKGVGSYPTFIHADWREGDAKAWHWTE